MKNRFSLDRTALKFLCPNCHKKRFVRYKDLETDRYLPDYAGRCDRETNCGYHYTPKQLFKEEPQLKQEYDKTTFNRLLFKPIEVAVTPDFIAPALVNQSMKKQTPIVHGGHHSVKMVTAVWPQQVIDL